MEHLKIREARKAAKMTQDELAKSLGINRATLSRYESGAIDPPSSQLQRIADALGISIYELLDDKEKDIYFEAEVNLVKANVKAGYKFTTDEKLLVRLFHELNEAGKDAAIDRVSDLTEIPRYRAETTPESPSPPQEGKDTTPPTDTPETAPEGE